MSRGGGDPPLIVDSNGFVLCPDCKTKIKVGPSGIENFKKRHRGTPTCMKNKKTREREAALERTRQNAARMFKPRIPTVPPVVAAPPPIHSTSNSTQPLERTKVVHSPCPVALQFLNNLRDRINCLPAHIPEADETHPLAAYSGDPGGCVKQGEDAWEKWDGPLNTLLQRTPQELLQLVVRGERGLHGFHRFLEYLVTNHAISGALIKNKVQRLINAINELSPQKPLDPSSNSSPSTPVPRSPPAELIDIDAFQDKNNELPQAARTFPCPGIIIQLPPGKSPHTAYPFGLHEQLGDPWDYSVVNGQLSLHARACKKVVKKLTPCIECKELSRNSNLLGIVNRMDDGVHENCALVYHGIGGFIQIVRRKTKQVQALRFKTLNDARVLVNKATVIDAHKEWFLAVASGRVERVDRLMRTGIKQKKGIHTMLELYEKAASRVYRTRSYTEDEHLRGLLLWRMAGSRVANIAHRSLGLPSMRTLRRHTIVPRLIASAGQPSQAEIEANTEAVIRPVLEAMQNQRVKHQILMFDEIKVEERPRWDDHTNLIQGICREHGKNASLEFTSEKEVNFLFDQVANGEIHLATNATVGAIGMLSKDHRLYSALPILISGQCGRESGAEHAKIIQATIDASRKSGLRTLCICSDGESRRGEAFALLTFKRRLSPTSPIYPLLSKLRFMNFEVGDDDLTADKDFKHLTKRARNLSLRRRGMKIHGIDILPSVLRSHLREAGLSPSHIDSILKPDDKQDVKLAFDLIYALWSLPSISIPSRPGFSSTHEALRSFGILSQHFLIPFICVDLSLSEQLTHLSAAAHMLLAMAHEDKAGSMLMPTQLYVDLMITIKNVFFCVAKVKIDDSEAEFFIILLGNDREEELYGILRTMVGSDASLDIMQLLLRLGGTTEVSTILAKHPEWDDSPRRLKIPALTNLEEFKIDKNSDHLKPASWRANVKVSDVNLQTCWMLGRQELKKIPRLDKILCELEAQDNPEIDILRPFGKDIVNADRDPDDYDDTAEDYLDPADTGPTVSAEPHPVVQSLDSTVEDAVIEEEVIIPKHDPTFTVNGVKVWKGRYLSEKFKDLRNPGSRDRLKRYADIPRYAIKNTEKQVESFDNKDSVSLSLEMPIISILKCEDRLFVCVGEVNDLLFDSKHAEQLPVKKLLEPLSIVSFQLLHLIPATIEDDPSLENDWRWSLQRGATFQIPGRLVEPIDPGMSPLERPKPYYLFDSKSLQAIGALILDRVTREDGKRKACFVCEDEKKEQELSLEQECPRCQMKLPSSPQRVLEHIAAHILYDSNIQPASEPCGLCLRPSQCAFYLKKGRGAAAGLQIDYDNSHCPNMTKFSYSVAAVSKATAPCSNVPVRCSLCPAKAPAIWRYNLHHHLKSKHPSVSLQETRDIWTISTTEKKALKIIWDERMTVKEKKKRRSKSKAQPMQISAAHSTRLALLDNREDDSDIDDEEEESGNEEENHGETENLNPADLDETDSEAELDEFVSGDCAPASAEVYFMEEMDVEDTINQNMDQVICSGTDQAHAIPPSITPETDTQVPQSVPDFPTPDYDQENSASAVQGTSMSSETHERLAAEEHRVAAEETEPSRRTRRKRAIILNECDCGSAVSSGEDNVIECKKAGCETRWFHLKCVDLRYVVKNWMCEACRSSTDVRARKRRR